MSRAPLHGLVPGTQGSPSLVQGIRCQQGVARHAGVPQPAGGDRPAVQPLSAGVQRPVPAQPAPHQAVPAGEVGSASLAGVGMVGKLVRVQAIPWHSSPSTALKDVEILGVALCLLTVGCSTLYRADTWRSQWK